jgi:two-component system, LytTR family, sensor histidine kinase LytS
VIAPGCVVKPGCGAARYRRGEASTPPRRRHAASIITISDAPARARRGVYHDVVSTPPDDRRREAPFVWVSTGRRIAAARVGRRWADVRGPLLAATALALLQAAVVYGALRGVQTLGLPLTLLVPIVTFTTLGLVLWMGLVRHAFGAVVPLGQAPAARILEVVEACRGALRDGFTTTSCRIVAVEIKSRLGYGAVAVTDRQRVVAHAGLAADHHGPGTSAPPGAMQAMSERRVARLPAGWGHGCDRRDCPLRSAVVAPIITRSGVVGSVILFSEGALNVSDRDRSIAQTLSDLLSTELQVGELELAERATASAELAALQAQIEPHFLFNSLNTIAAFCRTKPDEARELVLRFADYCRSSLRRPTTVVTLEDELGHVDAYLALEKARFGDSLEIDRRIAPSALSAQVPPFLIQPLVENAIKHGKTDRPLRVTIRAEVRFGRLRVSVRDNGRGIPREAADQVLQLGVGSGAAGLGLASVDQRLTALYGEEARLRIVSSPLFGTAVSVLLPVIAPAEATTVTVGRGA